MAAEPLDTGAAIMPSGLLPVEEECGGPLRTSLSPADPSHSRVTQDLIDVESLETGPARSRCRVSSMGVVGRLRRNAHPQCLPYRCRSA